jgi:hypothetical protein|tara:strand:- start:50 stop:532 length:483 start_codon:yes stop_codon:yes gene_type:complete
MAYKQEPGRGPMATFKNVTALLGPTANGVDPKTGVKNLQRPAYERSKDLGNDRKDLENRNKKAFNQTEIGKPLAANLSRLSQTINSKNLKLKEKSRKEYETAANLYRTSFAKYEKDANANLKTYDPSDIVIQKKTKVDKARQKAGKVEKFDPKKASNFLG